MNCTCPKCGDVHQKIRESQLDESVHDIHMRGVLAELEETSDTPTSTQERT